MAQIVSYDAVLSVTLERLLLFDIQTMEHNYFVHTTGVVILLTSLLVVVDREHRNEALLCSHLLFLFIFANDIGPFLKQQLFDDLRILCHHGCHFNDFPFFCYKILFGVLYL